MQHRSEARAQALGLRDRRRLTGRRWLAWDASPSRTTEAAAFGLEGHRKKSENSQEAKARAWLKQFLSDGNTYRASHLYEKAGDAGHAPWAVKKALHDNPEFGFAELGQGRGGGVLTEWFLEGALGRDDDGEPDDF